MKALLFLALLLTGCTTPRSPSRSVTLQLDPALAQKVTVNHGAVLGVISPFGWGMTSKNLGQYRVDEDGRVTINRIDPERDYLMLRHPTYQEARVGVAKNGRFEAYSQGAESAEMTIVGQESEGVLTIQLIGRQGAPAQSGDD